MRMRTLIADDEVLARQKLRRLLLEEPDIEIIGEGSTAAEILDLVKITSAELIFLDIHMPGMDGFELINRLYDAKGAQIPNVILRRHMISTRCVRLRFERLTIC